MEGQPSVEWSEPGEPFLSLDLPQKLMAVGFELPMTTHLHSIYVEVFSFTPAQCVEVKVLNHDGPDIRTPPRVIKSGYLTIEKPSFAYLLTYTPKSEKR